jgi:dethiobiotin synthetase
MNARIVVAGTDTGIGKTVFSAALVHALDGCYWKPVQSGTVDETDAATVRRLSGLGPERILPEGYRLATPVSPHLSAAIDGVTIDTDELIPPSPDRALVVETAGGLAVPLTRQRLYIDVLAEWHLPVVLCARTTLGTINHSLLSVEALRARGVPLLGIAFVGDENRDSEDIIAEMGQTRRLGRLPKLLPLTPATLRDAFAAHFRIGDFTSEAPT